MRTSLITRKTEETDITLSLELDGGSAPEINTGVGFLDHMLTLFAKHGHFGLKLECEGDVFVDGHHSVEDIGICLGMAFSEALGDKRGICRYGDITLPMDEALILCAVDISGRSCLCFDVALPQSRVGSFDTELVEEFFTAFTRTAGVTLHMRKLAGSNTHHIIEGCFKAFGRALSRAAQIDERHSGDIPSTKGVL